MRGYATGVLAAGCVLLAQFAHAAGYGLREHGADAVGAAYAGASATATDASYLAYNPAALGFVDDSDLALSLAGIFPTSSANYSATTSALTPVGGQNRPDGFIDNAALPQIALRLRLDDKWAIGVSVTAPWGLSTDYPEDWVGRYYALQTKLVTVNIAPVVSYTIAPGFVVAAGPVAQYADGKLSSAVDVGTLGALLAIPGSIPGAQDIKARYSADAWGWGFTVGAMAELNEAVTLGVAYRSEIDTDFDGKLDFQLGGNPIALAINGATGLFSDTPATTSLTTPATLHVGARVRLNERWTLLGEADWTDWSAFDELRIKAKNPAQPDDVTPADWKGAWLFAAGLEFQADERWSLKAGAAYDESPVPDSTFGPRIPDADRTWIALGARYRMSERSHVSFALAHLFLPERDAHLSALQPANALRGNLDGSSESGVTVVAVEFSFPLN
ncbi:MAG: OmpP1/FadL family transporter [Alphaproteobacteria bacterium]